MKKPNSIDFDNKRFTNQGVTFYIMTDTMGYDHTIEFLSHIPTLSNGISNQDFQAHLLKQMKILSSGNDFLKAHMDAYEHTMNLFNVISKSNDFDFLEDNLEQVLDFCTIFCITKDEDMTKFDKTVMDAKKENWKKGMNMKDFFLLSKTQLPRYKQLLEEFYNPENEEARAKRKEEIAKATQ